MKVSTADKILNHSKPLFAEEGYGGFSMRALSERSGVSLSSIYHFYNDKDELLEFLFNTINTSLGEKRAQLPQKSTATDLLYDRIVFQFENIEEVVFVLKYYLHFRKNFLKLDSGFLPPKTYLHVEEVLDFGINTGEFSLKTHQIQKNSKVIVHAINGYLLEYYPDPPKGPELHKVVGSIHTFLLRSLTNKEGL